MEGFLIIKPENTFKSIYHFNEHNLIWTSFPVTFRLELVQMKFNMKVIHCTSLIPYIAVRVI